METKRYHSVRLDKSQCNGILVIVQSRQRISDSDLGVIFTNADAFTAVDAALINDMRPAAANPDGFRRAMLETIRAAPALAFIQTNGMITFCFHQEPPTLKETAF